MLYAYCVLIYATLIQYGESGTTNLNKFESSKTLFTPSVSYPALVHLRPSGYSTELLENAAYYPRYVPNYDFHEYADSLQKQTLYQNQERRLGNILYTGDNKKVADNVKNDEDDYSKRLNNILFQEETKPELEDLDRRYKRSQSLLWTSPGQPTVNNLGNRGSLSNSRAVSYRNSPYPYATWKPYEEPRISSYAFQNPISVKNNNQAEQTYRRKRNIPEYLIQNINSDPNVIRGKDSMFASEVNGRYIKESLSLPIHTVSLVYSDINNDFTNSIYSPKSVMFANALMLSPLQTELDEMV